MMDRPFSAEESNAWRRITEDIAVLGTYVGPRGGNETFAGEDLEESGLARWTGQMSSKRGLVEDRPPLAPMRTVLEPLGRVRTTSTRDGGARAL